MTTNFRKYQKGDFDELVSMVMGLYTKDGAKQSTMNREKISLTVEKLHTAYSNGSIILFENEGVTIGYSIVNWFWSNEFSGKILYIDELYVKPMARNAGVGQQFFEFIQQNLEFESVAFMLETTRDNDKAVNFYQRIGFIEHHNHLMFKYLEPDSTMT